MSLVRPDSCRVQLPLRTTALNRAELPGPEPDAPGRGPGERTIPDKVARAIGDRAGLTNAIALAFVAPMRPAVVIALREPGVEVQRRSAAARADAGKRAASGSDLCPPPSVSRRRTNRAASHALMTISSLGRGPEPAVR